MNKLALTAAALFLASCNSDLTPTEQNGASAAADATSKTMSLLDTTWEFDDAGTPMTISIDRAGGYVEYRGGRYLEHGTYTQKDGKDCFTTALGDKAANCWTGVPQTEVGGTASATSDDGQTGVFKRVAYRELKLPA